MHQNTTKLFQLDAVAEAQAARMLEALDAQVAGQRRAQIGSRSKPPLGTALQFLSGLSGATRLLAR